MPIFNVIVLEVLHPLASVIDTLYVPAVKPVGFGAFDEYVPGPVQE